MPVCIWPCMCVFAVCLCSRMHLYFRIYVCMGRPEEDLWCLKFIRVSIAVIQHHDQEHLGRELNQKPWGKCCLLDCSPGPDQPIFLYNSGPPAQGWYHTQWTERTHMNHQSRKCPTSFNRLGGDIYSTEGLYFQMTPAPVKLTKQQQQ